MRAGAGQAVGEFFDGFHPGGEVALLLAPQGEKFPGGVPAGGLFPADGQQRQGLSGKAQRPDDVCGTRKTGQGKAGAASGLGVGGQVDGRRGIVKDADGKEEQQPRDGAAADLVFQPVSGIGGGKQPGGQQDQHQPGERRSHHLNARRVAAICLSLSPSGSSPALLSSR